MTMAGARDRRARRQRLRRTARSWRGWWRPATASSFPTRRRERARHLILLPTVDVVEADIHDPATLAALVRGADAVVNLVGILNETGRDTFARAHVDARAQRSSPPARPPAYAGSLHMSALNADPAGPSRYLRSKGEAEATRRLASGLAWTMFRPSVIFGRGDCVPQHVRAPRAPAAGDRARRARTRASSRCGSATSRTAFARALGRRRDDRRSATTSAGPKVYTLRELVRVDGRDRRVPCGRSFRSRRARRSCRPFALEHLPGKLMSRDNLASMTRDSVCDCPFPAGVRDRAGGARGAGAGVARARPEPQPFRRVPGARWALKREAPASEAPCASQSHCAR